MREDPLRIYSGGEHRNRAMLFACGTNRDYNVPAQSCKTLHEPADRETSCAIPHQQRYLRLLYAKDFGDLDLCHLAVLEDRMDLQREPRLEQLLLGIRKTKVRENISTAFDHGTRALRRRLVVNFHMTPATHKLHVATAIHTIIHM